MVQYSNNNNKILETYIAQHMKRDKVPKTIQRGRACSTASSIYLNDNIITYNKSYESYNLILKRCYIIN